MAGTSVVTLNRDIILQRIERGDRLVDIAKDYGLSDASSVQKRLADDPEYLLAKERGLESRMDKREDELEQAQDSIQVARARELLSHARWRAERECPKRWGPRQEITHVQGISITEALEQARQRVIDGEFRECYEREGGTPSGFGEVT